MAQGVRRFRCTVAKRRSAAQRRAPRTRKLAISCGRIAFARDANSADVDCGGATRHAQRMATDNSSIAVEIVIMIASLFGPVLAFAGVSVLLMLASDAERRKAKPALAELVVDDAPQCCCSLAPPAPPGYVERTLERMRHEALVRRLRGGR